MLYDMCVIMANFESLDDYLIMEMMEQLIAERQFKTLTDWMKTNHRFHRLGQLILDRYCQEVNALPPTTVTDDGNQIWEIDGLRHRDCDQPAVIGKNGTQQWYQHGELHRDGDQPAIIRTDGTQEWYQYGLQ